LIMMRVQYAEATERTADPNISKSKSIGDKREIKRRLQLLHGR
jgi:hypothetical protein